MINERFQNYFRETFFSENPEAFQDFLTSLEKPLPRTIRIRPGQEDTVRSRLEKSGYKLTTTTIPNVFSIENTLELDPLDNRLGFTLDHILGDFYIQELAAATSVHLLSEGQVHTEPFLVLDMASSPGGKTTQLAEHYPKSFIIANEPTRDRIPQLLQNLSRMGTPNVAVTLYPGQYFRNTPEVFDRILLDAPCSGEGTLYKGTNAVKHWHIKNIKTIAALQEKLLDAALTALKVGGEMLYSTCSMNLIENEGVLEKMKKKHGDAIEITFQKHFWPHIDGTGGFFVSKIRKITSLVESGDRENEAINNDIRTYRGSLPFETKPGITLYEHLGKILAVEGHPERDMVRRKYYCMRFGEAIGYTENGKIRIDGNAYRYLDMDGLPRYTLPDTHALDQFLRWEILEGVGIMDDGEVLVEYKGKIISKELIKDHTLSNSVPYEWRRK